jgi:hypothetical protein
MLNKEPEDRIEAQLFAESFPYIRINALYLAVRFAQPGGQAGGLGSFRVRIRGPGPRRGGDSTIVDE